MKITEIGMLTEFTKEGLDIIYKVIPSHIVKGKSGAVELIYTELHEIIHGVKDFHISTTLSYQSDLRILPITVHTFYTESMRSAKNFLAERKKFFIDAIQEHKDAVLIDRDGQVTIDTVLKKINDYSFDIKFFPITEDAVCEYIKAISSKIDTDPQNIGGNIILISDLSKIFFNPNQSKEKAVKSIRGITNGIGIKDQIKEINSQNRNFWKTPEGTPVDNRMCRNDLDYDDYIRGLWENEATRWEWEWEKDKYGQK